MLQIVASKAENVNVSRIAIEPHSIKQNVERALDGIATAVDLFERAALEVLARYDSTFADLAMIELRSLSVEGVVWLQKNSDSQIYGGQSGITDQGLLESALVRPQTGTVRTVSTISSYGQLPMRRDPRQMSILRREQANGVLRHRSVCGNKRSAAESSGTRGSRCDAPTRGGLRRSVF